MDGGSIQVSIKDLTYTIIIIIQVPVKGNLSFSFSFSHSIPVLLTVDMFIPYGWLMQVDFPFLFPLSFSQ